MWGIDDTQEQWDDQVEKINMSILNKVIETGVSREVMEHNFKLFDIYDLRGEECRKCNRGEACEEHKLKREIVQDLDGQAKL